MQSFGQFQSAFTFTRSPGLMSVIIIVGVVLRPCVVGDAGPAGCFLEPPRAMWCGRGSGASRTTIPINRSLARFYLGIKNVEASPVSMFSMFAKHVPEELIPLDLIRIIK